MCYGEALSAAVVRARKGHECGACGRIIRTGARYERTASVQDGEFMATKRCKTCAALFAESVAEEAGYCTYEDPDAREEVRSEPWRETLRRLRKAWNDLMGREAAHD